MIKIKRKVVLHGQSTLTISLPATWVKKFNVRKGDELNLEERDKELRINTEKEFSLERKEIDIKDLKKLGKTSITSSYRQGYDEIALNYDDINYIEVIQDLISKEITGFEMIEQGKNHCLIKDLTGSKDEFDTALRRIWLLTIDLSKESLNAIKKGDATELKNIQLMDYCINKFSNYCLRLLIKKGHVNFRKTPLYYYLVKSLEEIADRYKDLCNLYLNKPEKIDKNFIVIFSNVNSHLNEFYELFYKYDEPKIEELFRKITLTYSKIYHSRNRMEIYLSSICKDINDLLEVLVEINL